MGLYKMELYTGSILLLSSAQAYADKTNKVKSLEICKASINVFKRYTLEEFMLFKTQDAEILDIPTNPKEKHALIYQTVKKRLQKSNDERLIELNALLKSLTTDEENEILDVINVILSNPGEGFFL